MNESDEGWMALWRPETATGEAEASDLQDEERPFYELLPVSAGQSSAPAQPRHVGWRGWLGITAAFMLGTAVGVAVVFVFGHVPRTSVGSVVANTAQDANLFGAASGAVINQIVVDVHGDVLHPGVYTLPANARLMDAVTAAGGYLHPADADNVNAAAPLNDGAEVEILPPADTRSTTTSNLTVPPAEGLNTASGSTRRVGAPGVGDGVVAANHIDLNTADVTTLETLPDIGPARAQAIVAYRSAHGPFASVSSVTAVSGIGAGILSRITPYLFVNHSGE